MTAFSKRENSKILPRKSYAKRSTKQNGAELNRFVQCVKKVVQALNAKNVHTTAATNAFKGSQLKYVIMVIKLNGVVIKQDVSNAERILLAGNV